MSGKYSSILAELSALDKNLLSICSTPQIEKALFTTTAKLSAKVDSLHQHSERACYLNHLTN